MGYCAIAEFNSPGVQVCPGGRLSSVPGISEYGSAEAFHGDTQLVGLPRMGFKQEEAFTHRLVKSTPESGDGWITQCAEKAITAISGFLHIAFDQTLLLLRTLS